MQHVDDELKAIFADLAKKAQFMQLNLGGKNQRGPGGSPDTGTEQKLIDPEKKL